jgi:hypothetical protein
MKRRILLLVVAALASLTVVGVALAQSGHFLNRTVNCTDNGTTLQCTGKVTGLGGTTFEIVVSAPGSTAIVTCTNPGGNVAPGQNTTIDVAGSSGEIPTTQNGNYTFNVSTITPTVPNTPTCPNASWTATVTDVIFNNITITLLEDGNVSDVYP